jgi:DNA-directed RNA polymerase specialized sigma24 family protein
MLPFDDRYPVALDSKLVALAGDGSRDALGILLSLHDRFIYNVAVRMLGDAKRSEVFTTETLLKAILDITLVPKDGSFRQWLYSRVVGELMVHSCRFDNEDSVCSSSRSRLKSGVDFETWNGKVSEGPLSNKLPGSSGDDYLTDALFCLSVRQRLIFVLGGIFRLTNTQLSEITGLGAEVIGGEFRSAESRMLVYLGKQHKRWDRGADHRYSLGVGSDPGEPAFLNGSRDAGYVSDDMDRGSGVSRHPTGDLVALFRRQSFLETDVSRVLVRSFSISIDIKDGFGGE